MATNPTGLPQRYLRTPEAARFVGLSIRTLEKHRIYGTGPRYSKLGGRVVYSVEDLQTWVESGAKSVDLRPGRRDRAAGEASKPARTAANTQVVSLIIFLHVSAPSHPFRTRAAQTLPGAARQSRAPAMRKDAQ